MSITPLKPAVPKPTPCKICDSPASLFGVTDFNRSCEEVKGKFLPLSGVPVYYRRCPNCGFVFTDGFDAWSAADFGRHIYNSDYVTVDPDYLEVRPRFTAELMDGTFHRHKASMRVLDYGGGSGLCAAEMRRRGFLSVETYDPFTPEFARMPEGRFDLVTCFETLEHVPNPLTVIAQLAEKMADPGVVVFSTQVLPDDFLKHGMQWWYIGPRNGHISIFSPQALIQGWQRSGCGIGSFNVNFHIAFRIIPEFAKHLMPKG